jgi:hypothetical protein
MAAGPSLFIEILRFGQRILIVDSADINGSWPFILPGRVKRLLQISRQFRRLESFLLVVRQQ